jgi:hypothetical protein
MAHGLLIDGQGATWPDCSWALGRRIGHDEPALDVATFAVCRRGFIHLRMHGARARVALGAYAFSDVAFLAAVRALTKASPGRVMVATFVHETWRYEIFPGVWEFACHAETLVSPEGAAPERRGRALQTAARQVALPGTAG